MTYNPGDTVRLTFPDGKTLAGKITEYLPGYYQISKEDCYEVHGPGFVTICSARSFVK